MFAEYCKSIADFGLLFKLFCSKKELNNLNFVLKEEE